MAGHHTSHAAGLPHSDTLGSPSVHQLPEAYRRSPRPSSAPDTKASTMRSYTLTTLKTCSKPDNTQQQTITTIIHQMLASTIHKQKQQQEKHTTVCSPTTQQRAHPHAACPIQRAHNTRTQHTTKMHHESFCDVPPKNKHHTQHVWLTHPNGWLLLRKEVIQPHLPVRLPCYDLVPITSPTFDGSPHKG